MVFDMDNLTFQVYLVSLEYQVILGFLENLDFLDTSELDRL